MPVPVPPVSKPVAHPVHKPFPAANATVAIPQHLDSLYHLSQTLPASPIGPPAAFSTREEWINSLPVWRREKPRRSWDDTDDSEDSEVQGFSRGLIGAEDASVIKGEHAEACILPRFLLKARLALPGGAPADPPHSSDADADDEMSSEDSALDSFPLDSASQWSATSPAANGGNVMQLDDQCAVSCALGSSGVPVLGSRAYGYIHFTPGYESSGNVSGQEAGSSPLGPVTPFGDFVDRAVAAQTYIPGDGVFQNAVPQAYAPQDGMRPPYVYPPVPAQQVFIQDQVKQPPPPTDAVTPSANANYWRLAEPLSEWLANYIWKVCTTGLSLPPSFNRPVVNVGLLYRFPPSHLSASVHKLLLATLLQPSAVILSLWYISKLPVLFDMLDMPQSSSKELAFRELWLTGCDRDGVDNAPFRIIVLGFILANKWLDDHTFSNKTWHTITGIPVAVINKLELMALEIFNHNLSISDKDWAHWLDHVMSYHMSLAAPLQPISRPSTNPHALIRKALEEIIQAPVAYHNTDSPLPHPVFLGLEERKRDIFEKERHALEVSEINLDEDGPLREEYMPKRRAGSGVALHSQDKRWTFHGDNGWEILRATNGPLKNLPPPAKWSPAADEPILRDASRKSGHYVAVQPPVTSLSNGIYPIHHQAPGHDVVANAWAGGIIGQPNSHNAGDFGPMKPVPPPPGYPFEYPRHYVSGAHASAFNPVPGVYHSRTHSLSYGHEHVQPPRHVRSFSTVGQFDYPRTDFQGEHYPIHPPLFAAFAQPPHLLPPPQPQPEVEPHWAAPPSHFMYPGHHAFGHGVPHPQTAWLRA
ncbi:hypothetical protein AX16_000142 [Volvariella volvacea WC 439]|nr:hypothetical protein AX16_000142 [Volvariella volvacea WC 439]